VKSEIFELIKPAPSPYILELFGGPVSIETYRNGFTKFGESPNELGTTYNLNTLPALYLPTQIQKETETKQVKESISRISMSKSANTPLSKIKVENAQKRISKEITVHKTRSKGLLRSKLGIRLKD
jgi:hypothetical protein